MATQTSNRRLPSIASGYELREQIGQGTCAHVYRAWCQEINDEVAIKVVELEWLQASLEDIGREIQVMSLSSHPNVVPFSTAFVQGADLWVVMPLLTGGSVLSLMNCAYRDGLPEHYAKYVLWCVLKALEYFHGNGQMHRDVKAANLMLDSNGNTMLSDYGMMGWMVEGGWDRKQRQTFVGTPCWMAPEVMEQASGYDYKADVWSLGITAIELAQGRAPYYNSPPMKVLFLTLQNPPPTITGPAAETLSPRYHDFVAACLQKDPKLRPTAKQLLNHPLFAGGAPKPDDLASTIAKLPPIGSRGASQKQLYRQLQKSAASQRSGIYDLASRGLGWDFGDGTEARRPSDTESSNENSSTRTSQSSAPEASATSAIPFTRSKEDVTEAQNIEENQASRSTQTTVATSNSSTSLTNAAAPDSNASTATMSGHPPNPSVPTGAAQRATVPGETANQTRPPQRTGFPAKTVGLLKKGRFTVSDVPNPEKLDGKIDSFLDDSSDHESSPKEDSLPPPTVPPSLLPQNIKETKPITTPAVQSQNTQLEQSKNSQTQATPANILQTPTAIQQPYAQVAAANASERSFTSGVAPVVINVDVKPQRTDTVMSDTARPGPSNAGPPIPIHTVQQNKPNPQVTVVGVLPASRPIQNVPSQRPNPSTPVNHIPLPVNQASQTMGGEVNGHARLGTPARSSPKGNQTQQTVQHPIPVVIPNVPTQGGAGNVPTGAAQATTAAPPKRKSRFEVKDVPTSSAKAAPAASPPSNSGSSTPLPPTVNAVLPPSGGAAPGVSKKNSRFEVKDVEQKQRPVPNGSTPIVNIASSSQSTVANSSRQSTPLVSPPSESTPNAPQGLGKQAFSLLLELQHTIQALTQENETLRRENSFLRTKAQMSAGNNTSGLTSARNSSTSETGAKGSAPVDSRPGALHHVQSANSVVSHAMSVNQNTQVQHSKPQAPATSQPQGQKRATQVQTEQKVVTGVQSHAQLTSPAVGRAHMMSPLTPVGAASSHPQLVPPLTAHDTSGVKHSNSFPQYEYIGHAQVGQRAQQMASPNKVGEPMLQREQDRMQAAAQMSRMEQSIGSSGLAYSSGMTSTVGGQASHTNAMIGRGQHVVGGGGVQMPGLTSGMRTGAGTGVHVVNNTNSVQQHGNMDYGGHQRGLHGAGGARLGPVAVNAREVAVGTNLEGLGGIGGEGGPSGQGTVEHDQSVTRKDASLPG